MFSQMGTDSLCRYIHCYIYVKHNNEKVRWPRGRSDSRNMHMY